MKIKDIQRLLLAGILLSLWMACGPSAEEQEAMQKQQQDSATQSAKSSANGVLMRYKVGDVIQMKPDKVYGIITGIKDDNAYMIDYFDKQGVQHTCYETDYELE